MNHALPRPAARERAARPTDRRPAAAASGFTLVEIIVAMFVIGLLAALVVPRLSVLRGAALDASARQLAHRIRFLREDAALRGRWVRLVIDPARGSYRAGVLVRTSEGARFVESDAPLFRATRLPADVGIDIAGSGVTATIDGLPAAIFAPDGWADPAVIHLDDGAGSVFTIAIDPVSTRPRILAGRLDPRDLARP